MDKGVSMNILKVHEPEEGSKCCKVDCEFTEEEIEILLSHAVTDILKKQIKRMEANCEQGSSED